MPSCISYAKGTTEDLNDVEVYIDRKRFMHWLNFISLNDDELYIVLKSRIETFMSNTSDRGVG